MDGLWIKADGDHGIQHLPMHITIHHTIPPITRPRPIQQSKIPNPKSLQPQNLPFLLRRRLHELVKHVVIPFPRTGVDQSHFFQQVRFDLGAAESSRRCESYVDVLSETGGVVVAESAGITECFEDGIGLQDLLFDAYVFGYYFCIEQVSVDAAVVTTATESSIPGCTTANTAIHAPHPTDGRGPLTGHTPPLILLLNNLLTQHGKVIQYNLGSDSLTGTTLSTDQNGLIRGSYQRRAVVVITRRSRMAFLFGIHEHGILESAFHGAVRVVGSFVGVRWEFDRFRRKALSRIGLEGCDGIAVARGVRTPADCIAGDAATATNPLTSIRLHNIRGIQVIHPLKWINRNQNWAGARVDNIGIVSQSQCM
mmetsp:Transcript_41200/g.86424  ORF Transcript_41200/g.86424 Transcript_41200/m.86424 type:complete len:367 (-) Transcript_41200:775-1875(-)